MSSISKHRKEKKKGWKDIPIGGAITEQKTSLKNKTGSWRAIRPVLNPKKCTQCMMCVYYCPENSIHIDNDNPERSGIDLDYCKGCGLCANVCPVNAITMEEESVFGNKKGKNDKEK
jgi:pyruvate ferredoxin oxidoreductase delta subunit